MSPDTVETLKVLAPTLSAAFAFLSAIAALVSYVVNRRNLSAKFLDRVYELDKLIISNPGTYELLRSNITWEVLSKGCPSGTDKSEYIKVRALAYFYVNLFDEIHSALGGPFALSRSWPAWQTYIFQCLKRPLLQELICCEFDTVIRNGLPRLQLRSSGSVFTRAFLISLCDTQHLWYKQPETDALLL